MIVHPIIIYHWKISHSSPLLCVLIISSVCGCRKTDDSPKSNLSRKDGASLNRRTGQSELRGRWVSAPISDQHPFNHTRTLPLIVPQYSYVLHTCSHHFNPAVCLCSRDCAAISEKLLLWTCPMWCCPYIIHYYLILPLSVSTQP